MHSQNLHAFDAEIHYMHHVALELKSSRQRIGIYLWNPLVNQTQHIAYSWQTDHTLVEMAG